ncbi:MAG TPA: hypothetical protein H9703_00890 [Candidatus Faecalibacterium faecigallinarum]|uniref:Lipoprotein n=1 Tax=Candidatus Faecalibacterium faecigallinarum TaxID=2838577 RepID=A0A9D2P973_9FIRM|nr:hypothetical protein [Candidatus Faecalibacterium faecigallinarum]
MKILHPKQIRRLAALAASALLLAGCSGPSSMSSSSGSSSGSMGGTAGSAGSAGSASTEGWKAGLAVVSESEAGDAGGEVSTIAAAVLLDGEGRILHTVVDELETQVSAAEGSLTLPDDLRTKRQKGDGDYPLAAVSEIGKGWADQADALAKHLEGMTASEVAALKTDDEGRAADPDLLAGCTIRIDGYRDAIAKACREAKPIG